MPRPRLSHQGHRYCTVRKCAWRLRRFRLPVSIITANSILTADSAAKRPAQCCSASLLPCSLRHMALLQNLLRMATGFASGCYGDLIFKTAQSLRRSDRKRRWSLPIDLENHLKAVSASERSAIKCQHTNQAHGYTAYGSACGLQERKWSKRKVLMS